MRNTPNVKAERYRLTDRRRAGPLASDAGFGNNGAFLVPGVAGGPPLFVILSDGADFPEALGWEHASVRPDVNPPRCPTWEEMCAVKRLFWRDDEVVFQLHPAEADWVNAHPFVLHLWRKPDAPVPLPPKWMVAPTPDSPAPELRL